MKSQKLLFIASVFVFISGAHAGPFNEGDSAKTVDQNGVLRGDHGEVVSMDQAEAIKTCARFGMRLPTIRELVELNGITLKKPNEVRKEEIQVGSLRPEIGSFHPVSALNLDKNVDNFYYNTDSYVKPSGVLGNHVFWSSSVVSSHPVSGYFFGTQYGLVSDIHNFTFRNVRCVDAQ